MLIYWEIIHSGDCQFSAPGGGGKNVASFCSLSVKASGTYGGINMIVNV